MYYKFEDFPYFIKETLIYIFEDKAILEKIRVLKRPLPRYSLPLIQNIAGFTFGNRIYLTFYVAPTKECLSTLIHETVHVFQYKRGFVKFLIIYFYAYFKLMFTGKHDYSEIPCEVEAYELQNAFNKAIENVSFSQYHIWFEKNKYKLPKYKGENTCQKDGQLKK